MDQNNIGDLNILLAEIKKEEDADKFIEHYVKHKSYNYFYEFLNDYIAENQIDISLVMTYSRINKNYGYNITNGTRKNPGRDKILALCIGAEMSLSNTQRALEIAKVGSIYPKDERDVWIAVAINNKIRDVLKVNILLEEKGLPPLDV